MEQSREIEKLQRRWQENPLGLTFAPLAEAYRKEGMHEEALELLDLGLAQHPNYVPAHIVCARCQLDAGNDAKAEAAFLRVADLDPENVIALRGVADIAERGGRFQEAATRLEALLLFDRNNEEARMHLARVRGLLVMPVPGTIDPDAPTADAAEPEQPRPMEVPEVPEVPVAPEPTVSISMAEPESAPQLESERGPGAEASAPAVDVAGALVEDEIDEIDEVEASAAAAVGPEAIGTAVTSSSEPVAGFVEPAAAAPEPTTLEAGVEVPEDLKSMPRPAEDLEDDVPVGVEAAVLADPDLEVALYRPMELTAAPSTEYQNSSDAEALQGGSAVESGEPGERVPLFAAGSAEPAPTDPTEGEAPSEAAFEAEQGESPAGDEDAVGDDPGDESDEPELVVTETMAEVFLRQGHRELALAVYSQLRQRGPSNARIQSAIDDLEQELRPGRGSSMPAFAAALTGGRSVRGYFEGLLTAPVPGPPGDDDGLALGSVFGDEPGAAAEADAEPEGGPSFDEFFAGDAPEPAATPGAKALPAPAAASEDIEEFNAWLRGLKR